MKFRDVPVLLAALWVCASGVQADQVDGPDAASSMRSLDDQVQQIKSDVLGIAVELNLLEEQLLYPSNTQLAVFVALQADTDLRLDAVQLTLNGEQVAHYIYSFKELDALQEGGVHQLFTGNVARGAHALEVQTIGKTADGKDFSRQHSFAFEKGIEPSMLGLTLQGSSVQLADW